MGEITPEVKRPEAWSYTSPSTELTNEWSYTSLPICFTDVHSGKFTVPSNNRTFPFRSGVDVFPNCWKMWLIDNKQSCKYIRIYKYWRHSKVLVGSTTKVLPLLNRTFRRTKGKEVGERREEREERTEKLRKRFSPLFLLFRDSIVYVLR
jgi:hypothetical protein